MTGVTLLGPWPGTRLHEAQTTLVGELADAPDGVVGMPPLAQLPHRGPWADSVARTVGLLMDLPAELGPHGWKLADRPGRDLERCRSALREELDELAIAALGHRGPLVLSVRGPWTLAATLYLARGDRVLSDGGAVRDLVASMTEGLVDLVARLRTAVPGAEPVVVLREPQLPDVLAGTVPSFSGHTRLWSVPAEDATRALRQVVEGLGGAGARAVAHGGVRFATRSFDVLRGSGAEGVGVSAASLRGPQWEQVASAVEDGRRIWFGLPQEKHGRRTDTREVARQVAGPWTAVGLPARGLADVVVHAETSGTVAGGDAPTRREGDARAAVGIAKQVAARLAELAAG
ncbi:MULTISPECIES: hypothetical protein [unclassified Actinotalea]|uniref:hypothetical protein n=1 Tax=unclassified Actinotalea TaxID=2638618 RepID=UPI0015F5DD82|nr:MULTISPECIES: hypothetical protein [unclassified Actinotalea]